MEELPRYALLEIATALVIWGVHCVFKPNFIGYKMMYAIFQMKWHRFYDAYYAKPLVSCPACMSSVYGVAACFMAQVNFLHAPFFILALCGLNFIIIEILYPE